MSCLIQRITSFLLQESEIFFFFLQNVETTLGIVTLLVLKFGTLRMQLFLHVYEL